MTVQDNAHKCSPPTIGSGTVPIQPDWTCGVCGRVWRDWNGGGSSSVRWWAEIRGAAGGAATPENTER